MITSKLEAFSNDIFCKYREGVPAIRLAKEYGVCTTTMTTFLKKYGLAPHLKRGEKLVDYKSKKAEAVRLFNEGMRPSDIIRTLNVSRSWFYSVAKSENLNLRGIDHYVPTEESARKISATKQVNAIMTESEQNLFNILKANGINSIPQFSIGTYNVDFVIPDCSIAIELFCRGTINIYSRTSYIEDRIKELGNFGWHVYCLFSYDAKSVADDGIDDMLAWIDFIKRQPSARRQYRMFRRSFELLSCGCCDFN